MRGRRGGARTADGPDLSSRLVDRWEAALLRLHQSGVSSGRADHGRHVARSATAFETAGSFPSTTPPRHFDVTADGKRFLVVLPEGAVAAQRSSINLVLNWGEELNAKLPK